MPKKRPLTRRSVGAAAGSVMSRVLERPLAPKYLPSGSGNPSQTSESHCRERLPPLVYSQPWERRRIAGLRVAGGGAVAKAADHPFPCLQALTRRGRSALLKPRRRVPEKPAPLGQGGGVRQGEEL